MFWYEKHGDTKMVEIQLTTHEAAGWQQGDEGRIKAAERYALIHGLRRQAKQYAIKGVADIILGQGTIQSLQEKHPDVSAKSLG